MKTTILLLLLFTNLFSKNPTIYNELGDVIYANVNNIQKLKYFKQYANNKTKIDKYVEDVYVTKKEGFLAQKSSQEVDKRNYLSKLRELSKINDFYARSVKKNLAFSIVSKDNILFINMVNCGLVDVKSSKDKIMNYYCDNSIDINASGIIRNYLDMDKEAEDKREQISQKKKITKKLETKKLARIRANDLKEQRKVEISIEKKLAVTKEEIDTKVKDDIFH